MSKVLHIVAALLALLLLPLGAHATWWATQRDLSRNFRNVDWSSARLLKPANEVPQALVYIYAGRVGRWRGIFAHHSWIVVKPKDAERYTRYDKVGWGSPVRTDGWAPDGRWFGNEPTVVVAIEGETAERIIPRIRAAVAEYPYRNFGDYNAWPGPNSNTFVAYVMQRVPELGAALPPTAIGKDWQPSGEIFGYTPSRTGVRVTFGGYAGIAIGWIEGLEVNILGLVTGLDIRRPAIKLPGWGRIGMDAA